MRFLLVYLIASAGLQAQVPLSGEVALKKFQQKLESLTKFASVAVIPTVTLGAPGKACAIPLLRVPAALPSVDPKMPIFPKSDDHVHFHIVQVIPPAPSCDDANGSHVSWKE